MGLNAQIFTNPKGNITIQMRGKLNFENSSSIKNELERIVKENTLSIIILDLHFLDFVGSSGIGLFVNTIRSLNSNKPRVKLKNVKPEFLKVFKLYKFWDMEGTVIDLDEELSYKVENSF